MAAPAAALPGARRHIDPLALEGRRRMDPVNIEDAPLAVVHDRHAELPHTGVVDLRMLEGLQSTLDADDRRLVGLEVEVAAVELDEGLEEAVELAGLLSGEYGKEVEVMALRGGDLDK